MQLYKRFLILSHKHIAETERNCRQREGEMGRFACETESWVSPKNTAHENLEPESLTVASIDLNQKPQALTRTRTGFDEEGEYNQETAELLRTRSESRDLLKTKNKKKRNQVLLEGYVETDSEDDLKRTKSLTDEDLDELKGCLDLGFGFSYEEIPELCNTLPALELCYSMSQKFQDEHHKSPENSPVSEPASSSIANWKISSPGEYF